jgi:hypothetical protein
MNGHRGNEARGYRSLALCRVYITAREADTAIGRLPAGTLRKLGVTCSFDSATSATTFRVRVPRGLSGDSLRARMRRLEKEVGEKRGMLCSSRGGQEGQDGAAYRLPHDIGHAGRGRRRAVFGSDPLEEGALLRMASQRSGGDEPKDIF